MAYLTGLKKQINKANQFMSEKITGVEGTKLDDDFHTQERKTDLYVELVDDLQIKTKEYLQPNPTVRAKMAAVKGISKLSGQAKASTYPQPEGTLGEAMLTYGNKLQDFDRESVFASSLIESGEALKGMADLKYALDDNVKQNYLEPLHHLQSKDLKEVAHHRKKLQGRKLDYDCKKRKQQSGGAVPDKEIKQAEDKFAESLHLAQMGMHNIMEADIEQISQLMQFAEALLEYHKQCSEILQGLTDTLYSKSQAASSRQRREFTPKTLEDLGIETSNDYSLTAPAVERALRNSTSNSNFPGSGALISTSPGDSPVGTPSHHPPSQLSSGFNSGVPSPRHTPVSTPTKHSQPTCQALYDFEPENSGELGFKEGDMIILKQKVDDNWFEGSFQGRTGFFPINYVTVVVPLP